MFRYDGNFVESLNLTIEVASFDPPVFNDDARKLTGEISFYGKRDDPLHDAAPYHGFWRFCTAERFSANIELKFDQIERLWNIYSANPRYFRVIISEGPPVPELDRNFEGDFRMYFRAWSEPL
jgi:hypothetical protein